MKALMKRVDRLERPQGGDPTHEDWVDVLNAADPDAALKDLERRYPKPWSGPYVTALDRLGQPKCC